MKHRVKLETRKSESTTRKPNKKELAQQARDAKKLKEKDHE